MQIYIAKSVLECKIHPFLNLALSSSFAAMLLKRLQLALIHNPRHPESMSEVRLLRARQGRTMPNMLGSLLGKKGKSR